MKALSDARNYQGLFDFITSGSLCPEDLWGVEKEHGLLAWKKDLRDQDPLESAMAILVTKAHWSGDDTQCLRTIDAFQRLPGGRGSAEREDAAVRFATYCYPGCAEYGGSTCKKAAKKLEEMARGEGISNCTCQLCFEHADKVLELKKQGKFREIFKLLAMGALCSDGLAALGVQPRWDGQLENGMAILVSEAHQAGADAECLDIIDDYQRSRPKKEFLSAEARRKDAARAIQTYTNTCYSACAKHGGSNCDAAAKARVSKR